MDLGLDNVWIIEAAALTLMHAAIACVTDGIQMPFQTSSPFSILTMVCLMFTKKKI